MKRIAMAVAISTHNNIIGKGNTLPWGKNLADLRHFRKLTLGRAIIMGRKSLEDILAINGGPLADRLNIVLTRDKNYRAKGCIVTNEIMEALQVANLWDDGRKHGEIFVAGGAEIYRQFLPMTDRLEVTYIDYPFEGDVCFPDMPADEWNEINKSEVLEQVESEDLRYKFWFSTLKRASY